MDKIISETLPLIMFIDDTSEDLYINNRMIEKYGKYEKIIQFNMGTLALEYLKTNSENIQNIPDIILVDIHMPQMNGFEFLEEYAKLPDELKSKCRVYVVSSSFDSNDIAKAKADPYVTHFLEKPLTRQCIEEVINNVKVAL